MAKAKKSADPADVVKAATEDLLASLEISSSVRVVLEEEVFKVNVETEESGLLIGFHGDTLSSFQLILGLVVFKKLGQWSRVVVEVGDYRAKREAQLKEMAQSYAAQVISSGMPMTLPYLPPIERRIIHLALQENPDVQTESEGEGDQRRVTIKIK